MQPAKGDAEPDPGTEGGFCGCEDDLGRKGVREGPVGAPDVEAMLFAEDLPADAPAEKKSASETRGEAATLGGAGGGGGVGAACSLAVTAAERCAVASLSAALRAAAACAASSRSLLTRSTCWTAALRAANGGVCPLALQN